MKKETITVKDLPETLQIADGDYLIVEQRDGTYILDYTNLLLEPSKTAISTQVYANTTDIEDLSSNLTTTLETFSADLYAQISRVYIGKATITIDSGTYNSGILNPRPPENVFVQTTDFQITAANGDACKYPGYVSFVDNTEDNRGFFSVATVFSKSTLVADVSTGEVTVTDAESTADELLAAPSYNVTVVKTY